MARMFLCYRSRDEAYAAALLDEKLSRVFGADDVFRAGRCIAPGEDYQNALHDALSKCERLLVLIGPQWAGSFDPGADEAPSDTTDWVRYEIAAALAGNVRIVPVMLAGAERPREADLPADICALARRQSVRFEHRSVDGDFERLVRTLRLDVEPTDPPKSPIVTERYGPAGERTVAHGEKCLDGTLAIEATTRDASGHLLSRVGGRVRAADMAVIGGLLGSLGNGAHQ